MLWYYSLSLTEAQHNFHPAPDAARDTTPTKAERGILNSGVHEQLSC